MLFWTFDEKQVIIRMVFCLIAESAITQALVLTC